MAERVPNLVDVTVDSLPDSPQVMGGPPQNLDAAVPAQTEAGESRRLLSWDTAQVAQLTLSYLAVRAVLLIADVLAAHQSYAGHLAGPVTSWDSHFYISIARSGYPAEVLRNADGSLAYSSAGFLPVFPLIIAAVNHLGAPSSAPPLSCRCWLAGSPRLRYGSLGRPLAVNSWATARPYCS